MAHPIIEFYLEQRKTPEGFDLNDLLNLPSAIIGDGYFYIPWLFPVDTLSKWNKKLPHFTAEELDFFKNNAEIQIKFLLAVEKILFYFGIYLKDNTWIVKDDIQSRPYWLRNIGHESKKISRIIRSLHYCGQPELAKNLQQLAIKLGEEKGIIQENTLEIWANLLND
ncbi:opioid growth factor receptor-related protein [Caviibacterium pharyngocola]|uniref:Opioid growth factor receptor (OGFr) conserved domain-containing protein n=1 Tax=Caviibacterium pharyngocola TaxID=28159 RepID=A0A2M8RX32_9PAST|nr:opioid growth factor receptor-related protein [Caviibacterium pharyngocola]PJG83432.1 hypothetical protein CVP04_04725 [Caviibacterium pharyngocola]